MLDRLLTVSDVAVILGKKPKTVHEYVRTGDLQCVQLSPRDRRFTEDHLRAFIESRTVNQPKIVDASAPSPLPSPKKGGERGKEITGGSIKAQLRKEIAQW